MIKLTSYLTTILLVLPAYSAELNLKQAINEFYQSPKMQRSSSEVNESNWKKRQSYESVLPNIYGRANHYFNQKYFFLNPNTTYAIGFQLPIFDGFANYNRISSASHFNNGAIKNHDWNQFVGEREIILQYYKAIASKSLQAVAEKNLKALNDHLNDVNLFKKSGLSTKFDVLKVEAQKSEAESELLNANDNVQNSKSRLGEILGTPEEQRNLIGELPVLDKKMIEVEDQNINRLDIQSLEEKYLGLSDQSSAESRYYIPKIAFFGEYMKYNQTNKDFSLSDHFKNGYNIGMNLTWTLFDGMKSIAKDQIAEEQKIQTLKTLEMAKVKAINDAQFWKRKFTYFVDTFKARLADIERANESVRLAKEGRKVGTRTNTDLLDAEAELFRAEAASINAQLSSIEALINYELAIGKQIYQF